MDFGSVIVLVLMLALYFLPYIVAKQRRVANTGSILVINLFLGWTFVGWIIALAMAAKDNQPKGAF